MAGQVFQGLFSPRMDSRTAENLEPGMSPGVQQIYMIGSDFPP
jgi:hypothetical protein